MKSPRPIVHTYHKPGAGAEPFESAELIKLWQYNWSSNGFEARPIVEPQSMPLALSTCRRWSGAKAFKEHVASFPSINPFEYEMACWLRWPTIAMVAPMNQVICMADYDVFIYGQWIGEQLMRFVGQDKLCIMQGHVPSVVVGTHRAFWRVIDLFQHYAVEPDDIERGRPHLSDMHLLAKLMKRFPDFIIPFDAVKSIGEYGWETSPLVHYNNYAWKAQGLPWPRHEHIRGLRRMQMDPLSEALTEGK